jgi:hypothetical protein
METETLKDRTEETRHIHLSSITISQDNAIKISRHARMRWKIENEGFNIQKNQGYYLEHKYSRANWNAMQNYYQCRQIAHIINQLAEKEKAFNAKLCMKDSFETLWQWMFATLIFDVFEMEIVTEIHKPNYQLMY